MRREQTRVIHNIVRKCKKKLFSVTFFSKNRLDLSVQQNFQFTHVIFPALCNLSSRLSEQQSSRIATEQKDRQSTANTIKANHCLSLVSLYYAIALIFSFFFRWPDCAGGTTYQN